MGKNNKKSNKKEKTKNSKIKNVIISLKKNIKKTNKKVKEINKKTSDKSELNEQKEIFSNQDIAEKNRFSDEIGNSLKIKKEIHEIGKDARLKEQARLQKMHKAINAINRKPTMEEIEEEEQHKKYILKAKQEADKYEMEQELNRKIEFTKKQIQLKHQKKKQKSEKEKTKEERIEEFKKGIRRISGTGDVFKQLKEISEQGYEEMPNLENNEEER